MQTTSSDSSACASFVWSLCSWGQETLWFCQTPTTTGAWCKLVSRGQVQSQQRLLGWRIFALHPFINHIRRSSLLSLKVFTAITHFPYIFGSGASALFSASFWFYYNTAIKQTKSIYFSYYKYWLTFPVQRKLTPLALDFDLGLFVEGKWMHTSHQNTCQCNLP